MRVGILGAGQLAALLAHSAYQLNLETLCFSDNEDTPAKRLSPLFIGNLNNAEHLKAFAEQVDVITLENENIDTKVLETLMKFKPVYPDAKIIAVAQERWLEKTAFQALAIPTPPIFKVDSLEDLRAGIAHIGTPCVLKTRRFGYDGKGQVIIRSPDENLLPTAWQQINAPAILEGFVNFDFEVSLIAARGQDGAAVFYPLIRNTHENGILRTSESPFIDAILQEQAENYVGALLEHFNYVGVLAFEFFVVGKKLIANEIAPRVHNSGHLTIEGFNVSQFENHLRAVAGLPLIQPQALGRAVMTNIIGEFPKLKPADYAGLHVYHYGKAPRAGRKLGHATRVEDWLK